MQNLRIFYELILEVSLKESKTFFLKKAKFTHKPMNQAQKGLKKISDSGFKLSVTFQRKSGGRNIYLKNMKVSSRNTAFGPRPQPSSHWDQPQVLRELRGIQSSALTKTAYKASCYLTKAKICPTASVLKASALPLSVTADCSQVLGQALKAIFFHTAASSCFRRAEAEEDSAFYTQ